MTEPLLPPDHVPLRPTRFSPWPTLRTLLADLFYLPRWQQTLLSLGFLAAAAGWIAPLLHPAASTPWLGRAGASLLIGFIAGWLFRTFLKITALLAVAVTAILGTISYFHITSPDTNAAATQKVHASTTWLTEHATKLKNAAVAHVPSTTTAAFGLFLGARKKKRVT